MGLLVLVISVLIVFAYPILIIPITIFVILYFLISGRSNPPSAQSRLVVRKADVSPNAIMERRLLSAIEYEVENWKRTPVLDIGAKSVGDDCYCGIIKTVTGLEIWRCSHVHHVQRKRHSGRRYYHVVDPSITAARACASKELALNHLTHLNTAQNRTSGKRHSRSSLQHAYEEPWNETWKAFKGACAYCGKVGLTDSTVHKDHVVPLHVGGDNTTANILPSCSSCNLSKGVKSVFAFLALTKVKQGKLPIWVESSPTWQDFTKSPEFSIYLESAASMIEKAQLRIEPSKNVERRNLLKNLEEFTQY